jgi:ornithine cyclodeaminase/alanine dehydrogenase-like protein (mu-crystallin family)
MEESGDLSQPLHDGLLRKEQVQYIGDWLLSEKKPLLGQTTFFKSVGMGLIDLCVAKLIYSKALTMGLGQKVEFGESS